MVFRIESSLGGRNIFCRERFEEGACRQGKTDREIRERGGEERREGEEERGKKE